MRNIYDRLKEINIKNIMNYRGEEEGLILIVSNL